ncbi:MAG: XRE family transcriptional regulator [Alphaproteobacteria bacterium CG11_big_fil_rev_8_21_14_0_20_39_49]|nr:MAG: XRE family transcriptional regulator [Alphaproteobacteria bacterium CG11_big_fil_rev_8_21_14_0_20_39_49]
MDYNTIQDNNNIGKNEVLSKAILNLKDSWQLSNKDIAEIIGVDSSFITRLKKGQTQIEHDKKTGQLSLMLIRVFRSLGAFLGDRMTAQQQWLDSYNRAFNSTPIDAMKNVEGLSRVVIYLDALRGSEG